MGKGRSDMGLDPATDHDEHVRAGRLVVDFCEEVHVVAPGESLTFGRSADLSIDDNEFLHRNLGKFEKRDSTWWVANIGSQIEFDVFDRATRASARVTPGSTQAMPGSDVIIRFVAGPTSYELLVRCPAPAPIETTESTDTVSLASMAWTDDQRLLMTILAESLLRQPQAPLELPSNKEAQERLGWSAAKFNRKLDNVCDRLTGSGVRGLEKGVNSRNNERRRILAETAVHRGILTQADLQRLEGVEQQVRVSAAATGGTSS